MLTNSILSDFLNFTRNLSAIHNCVRGSITILIIHCIYMHLLNSNFDLNLDATFLLNEMFGKELAKDICQLAIMSDVTNS